MSEAYKCDWCGEIKEGDATYNHFRFELVGVGGQIEVGGTIHLKDVAYIDLCPSCKTDILSAIVNLKEST